MNREAAMSKSEFTQVDDDFLELVSLDQIDQVPAEENKPSMWRSLLGPLRRHAMLLIMVVLPVSAAILYYGLILANRYQSEARFVVRTPSRGSVSSLNSFLQTTGLGRSSEDADLVYEFIKSRDALQILVRDYELRLRLARPEADPFWRYPRLFGQDKEEILYRHFQHFLTLEFDKSSGISTLRVQAFRPDDAAAIALALLEASEQLINRLNQRAKTDSLEAAEAEVIRSRARADEARQKVTAFRTRLATIDPSSVSTKVIDTIGKLSLEIAQVKIQLRELQRSSPQNPQIDALRGRIAALEVQTFEERRRLGGSEQSLAQQIAEYERLNADREFADKALDSAMASLEAARTDVQRQQLYLERVVEPRPSDYPEYPRRILSILLAFAISVSGFAIVNAVLRNIREHTPQ